MRGRRGTAALPTARLDSTRRGRKRDHHGRRIGHPLVTGTEFIGDDSVALVVGDNMFYGRGLGAELHPLLEDER